MIRNVLRAFVPLLLVFSIGSQNTAPAARPQMLGFTADNAVRQAALESRFDGFLKAENLSSRMKRLTARPHHLREVPGAYLRSQHCKL